MEIIKGHGISGGIAFGTLCFYKHSTPTLNRHHIDDCETEIERYRNAKQKSISDLQNLYKKALTEVGEKEAEIFQIHQMMLEDVDYEDSILDIIRNERVNAEYAVQKTADNFAEMFSSMDDSYMKARAADVRDISQKLISVLLSRGEIEDINIGEPVIIVADDLMPSETVQIDKSKLLGFALLHGSANAHTAILARTMNIPAVIHLDGQLDENCSGRQAILDGGSGTVYIDPDKATVERMEAERRHQEEQRAKLESLRGKENVTLDGLHINIYANIERPRDVENVIRGDADGIGLFRSEFLYLGSTQPPAEEEQFEAYRSVLTGMKGKTVIIRTLDIGADKNVDYLDLPQEENPALGLRAIRLCFDKPHLFRTQLRALYRASAYGKLGIMFPMIASVWEVRQIREIIETVKSELRAEGKPFADDVQIGIMVETPAAAILSDELAKEVDFFSIGTNDLIQYTLAADRRNGSISSFYDPHHKAVLRLIRRVAENAHKAGIWVGICGELGADTTLTETFLAMGIDELSITPARVLEVRDRVRTANIKSVRDKLLEDIGI